MGRHRVNDRLAELVSGMVDVPSPTGEERPLAEHLCEVLAAAGLDARVQPVGGSPTMANAVGRRPGTGGGRSLLLYAPIDTVLDGDPATDLPWAGDELRADMRPHADRHGDVVAGLGAHNPKGHVACIVAAVEALAAVELAGDLIVGFGAGGMPTNARRAGLPRGHGDGCAALLGTIATPNAAVIAKSGWAVSWEEVGLAWYEVRVGGTHTYVGSRHLFPYRSAIADAAAVITELEAWFPRYAERHRGGLVAPQGVVSFVAAGWERMPAFTPATCRIRIDLRVSPRASVEEADGELGAELAAIADRTGADITWARIVAVPGTSTDPEAPILDICRRAWEAVAGRPHEPIAGLSGATDANILRAAGIPTARVGLPKVAGVADFEEGMNTVSLGDMGRLTDVLVRVVREWCA